MGVSYDVFAKAFLEKVKEYDFLSLEEASRTELVDDYMKRACSRFNRVCAYDIVTGDDNARELDADIPPDEIDEIADIVSEGMLEQWLKPQMYKQENYENMLNTTDFNGFSPAELLYRITSAYNACKRDFRNAINDYSYNHGDLTDLHL